MLGALIATGVVSTAAGVQTADIDHDAEYYILDPQYSIIKLDNSGSEWNIRVMIVPVIRSPFSR